MSANVFHGKVAKVDLSTGQVEYDKVCDEDARLYIGARGLGVKYVYDNGPDVEPFSAENILAFVAGPLTGTDMKMSGRWACVTKSPLTGTVVDSHMGGWSGARFRWAGLDALIVRGQSSTPVYLDIADGTVEIRDATALWGKTTSETIRILTERHGGSEGGKPDLSVVTIGQAGETLSRMAAWVDENTRSFGRGGTGAVGGFKRLKALVIRGSYKDRVRPNDPDAWKPANKAALDGIRDENNTTSPKKGGLSVYGTNVLMNVINTHRGPAHQELAALRVRARRGHLGRDDQRELRGEEPNVPRLSGGLQEGSRNQGRTLCRAAHGECGVRIGLGRSGPTATTRTYRRSSR